MLVEKLLYLFEGGYDLNIHPSSFASVDDVSEEMIGDQVPQTEVVLNLKP